MEKNERRAVALMSLIKPRYVVFLIVFWNLAILWLMEAPTTHNLSSDLSLSLISSSSSSSDEVYDWLKHREALPTHPLMGSAAPPPSVDIRPIIRKAVTESMAREQQRFETRLSELTGAVNRLEKATHAAQRLHATTPVSRLPTPPSDKQTLVLPVGPNDLERFQNLYKSLEKFFDFSEVEQWIIITPSRDSDIVKGIEQLTKEHASIIRVMEDREVVPRLKTLPTTNWMTQQIIKLGVADHVTTRFYLVLDADVLCFKLTRFSDLVAHGRAFCNSYESKGVCTREEWWAAAEKVLDMKLDTPTYFGVTPAFLATEIVKKMRTHLETVQKVEDWSEYLLQNVFKVSFTEYTLYFVYAQGSGLFDAYHRPAKNSVYNHELSVWYDSEFGRLDIEEIVEHAPFYSGHFLVVQSNTKIPASDIAKKMGAAFD